MLSILVLTWWVSGIPARMNSLLGITARDLEVISVEESKALAQEFVSFLLSLWLSLLLVLVIVIILFSISRLLMWWCAKPYKITWSILWRGVVVHIGFVIVALVFLYLFFKSITAGIDLKSQSLQGLPQLSIGVVVIICLIWIIYWITTSLIVYNLIYGGRILLSLKNSYILLKNEPTIILPFLYTGGLATLLIAAPIEKRISVTFFALVYIIAIIFTKYSLVRKQRI